MGWVTQDQIERARQVDVLDYILRHEPDKVKRVGSAYRMKDHPSFEIRSGRWRWYSQGMFGKTRFWLKPNLTNDNTERQLAALLRYAY